MSLGKLRMGTAARRSRHGISLVEVVAATLLVGIVLVGALQTVDSVVRSRRVNSERLDGPALAEQLATEVLAAYYTDPEEPGGSIGLDTDESGLTRADFDDVDDFAGWTATPPEYSDGTPISGYEDWTRAVSIDHADPTTGAVVLSETGVKRIHVEVTAPDGTVTDLYCLRSEYGGNEQAPAADTTVVHWLGAEIQIGNAPLSVGGADLTNHADDIEVSP